MQDSDCVAARLGDRNAASELDNPLGADHKGHRIAYSCIAMD